MTVPLERLCRLSGEQADKLRQYTARLAEEDFSSHRAPELLADLPVLASAVPLEQRRYPRRFAFEDTDGYCVIPRPGLADSSDCPHPVR